MREMAIDWSDIDRRPFEYLTLLSLGLLFTLSGGVLFTLFGINYSGSEGSIVTKVHPGTFIALSAFCLMLMNSRNDKISDEIWYYKAPLLLLAINAIYAFYIIAAQRRAIASTVDTFLLPVILTFLITKMKENIRDRAALLLHGLMTFNALLALIELLLGQRFFPFVIDGISYEWDVRSTALLGHPLENAAITGSYVMIMLFGGAKGLPPMVKSAFILLQFAALGAFGGRTAFLLVLLGSVVFLMLRLFALIRGERVPLETLAIGLIATPLVIGGMAAIFMSGTFDVLLDRFTRDGGSANARIIMFDLFENLTFRDFLWGGDLDLLKSKQTTLGIEMGIENPIIKNILVQGAFMTSLLILGLAGFFRFILQQTGKLGLWPFGFFFIIIMSFESISGKTIMLAQFTALMLVLYPSLKRQ